MGKSSKPLEISSKKPSTINQPTLSRASSFRPRDPRFEEASGHYNEDLFKKSYSWLEDTKKNELEEVKAALVKENDPETRARLKAYIQRETARQKMQQVREKARELKKQRRKEEETKVRQGKKPFYLKKADEKKVELIAQYATMKDKKSLPEFLEKRRQRAAAKQHKRLPYRQTHE